MALAVTYSTVDDNVIGAKRSRAVSIVPDSSYPLGGEAFLPASVGFVAIDRIIFEGPAVDPDTADNAVVAYYDKAAGTIEFFWSNDDGGADGPLVECAAGTNLSAYTLKALVIGY